MEADNGIKESLSHCQSHVRMSQRNEVCHLGETVYNFKDHRLAPNPRKTFHKVHSIVRDIKGLQQPGRVEVFRFVALTD
jgi:hypothetical protein